MKDDARRLVYTAQSKQFFYCRDAVCEYVFRQGAIPLNPFRVFDYFLNDRVDRDAVREGNRRLIEVSDEVWVFGRTLADGVILEISLASRYGKPVRYFSIDTRADDIHSLLPAQLGCEDEVVANSGLGAREILDHIVGKSTDAVVLALGRTRELSGI
jgi:hypothetical protein